MKKIVFLLLFLFISLASFAHGVQVAYTVMPNGFVRIYVQHWHNDQTVTSLVNNGMNITTSYGSTVTTQNLNPSGAVNNTGVNSLPAGSGGIKVLYACSAYANTYKDWAYYDFAPAAFGVQVLITLNSGNSAVLAEACTELYPQTITATFIDSSPPTITCPAPVATVSCGSTGTNVNFVATATDNAGVQSITYSIPPGSFFPVGSTNVMATATDINGFTSSCTFPVVVKVVDNIPPSITCPVNISVNNDNGKCGATIAVATVSATDNCGTPSVIGVRNDGLPLTADYPKGVTTITWTATDGNNLKATCMQTIMVTDIQKPIIACPSNISSVATTLAGTSVNYMTPVGTDNCLGAITVRTSGFASETVFPIGETTVTYTVTDGVGLSAECSFKVTISGAVPVIKCPTNITVNTTATDCGANVNFTATETTAVPVSTITYSPASGSFFSVGTTTVTATATNILGESACTFTVKVIDNKAPIAAAQNSDVFLDENGQASITIDQVNNGSKDNCGTPTFTIFPTSFSCNDVAGVSSARNAMQFNGGYIDVPNQASLNPLNEWTLETWVKTSVSGIQQGLIEKYDCGNNYGYLLRITNANKIMAGVTSGCSFGGAYVTGGTTIAPNTWYHISATFSRTGNVKLYVNGILEGTAAVGPIASSPSAGSLKIGARGNDANERLKGMMDEVRIWSVARTQTQLQASMKKSLSGSESGLQAYYRFEEPIASSSIVDITPLTIANNGTLTGVLTRVASTVDVGHSIPVTLTASDVNGNSSTTTAFISVFDKIAPMISCPPEVSVIATGAVGSVVNYDTPVGTDNCSAPMTTIIAGLESGATFPIGITTVTHKVTDLTGLTAECSFNVTVTGLAPVIACPENITVNTTTNQCDAIAHFEALEHTAIPASIVTYSQNSGTTFPIGVTTVNAIATNAVGTSACSFTVTIEDNEKPVISCPTPLSIPTDLGVCGAITKFEVTSTDNCSSKVAFTSGLPSGSTFPVGITTNVYTATDAAGNTSTCSFTVEVKDNEKPAITCPIAISTSRNTNPGLCTYSVMGNELNATAKDNCGITKLTYALSGATTGSGNSLKDVKLYPGTTTVTWTTSDAAGNTTICLFTVVISDDQNPTGYIISAKNEVKFGEYNYINGNVGVMAADGKAYFSRNDVLNPYFIKAKNINTQLPSGVTNMIYSPATDVPNPIFYTYNGNTSGLSNFNMSTNMVLSGNYKDLTIKKGVVATLQGNNFGKINIEEGAKVTFSSPVINIEDLDIKGGKKGESTTNVYFTNPTYIKIKDKVKVASDCQINVGGPKVTFYLADTKADEEKFIVKSDNTQLTANIMIPNGKLKVEGGDSRMGTMTGWYVIDKLESNGKYTTWNTYDCSMTKPAISTISQNTMPHQTLQTNYQANDFTVYPNPAQENVWVDLISYEGQEVTLVVSDVSGKTIQQQVIKNVNAAPYNLNMKPLPGGLYFIKLQAKDNQIVTKKLQVTK